MLRVCVCVFVVYICTHLINYDAELIRIGAINSRSDANSRRQKRIKIETKETKLWLREVWAVFSMLQYKCKSEIRETVTAHRLTSPSSGYDIVLNWKQKRFVCRRCWFLLRSVCAEQLTAKQTFPDFGYQNSTPVCECACVQCVDVFCLTTQVFIQIKRLTVWLSSGSDSDNDSNIKCMGITQNITMTHMPLKSFIVSARELAKWNSHWYGH